MNLKTINMIAEEFLKQKLDMKSMPLSLTLKSDKLFALMEQYHEARMKEELINFLQYVDESCLKAWITHEPIVEKFLATRKNKC